LETAARKASGEKSAYVRVPIDELFFNTGVDERVDRRPDRFHHVEILKDLVGGDPKGSPRVASTTSSVGGYRLLISGRSRG
jgi:hypothetical protein